MLKKISIKFVDRYFNEHLNKEEVSYGLEVLLSIVISNGILLVMAFLFGYGAEMVAFMVFFNLLRMSAGGYHCKTHLTCFLLYCVTGFVDIVVTQLIPSNMYLPTITVCLVVSVALIYLFAPMQTPNRPIFPKECLKFRKRSVFTFGSAVLVITMVGALRFWNIALVATFAILAESLSLIHFTKKGGVHHDKNKRNVIIN